MNTKPLISILVATWNYAHFLKDAIESAINQDYPQKNVWVIDDASTDNTRDIIMEYEEATLSLPNIFRQDEMEYFGKRTKNGVDIYYIRLKTNGGPSRARNIGIVNALAGGAQLIQILDADDILRPNKVAALAAVILTAPDEIGVAYSDYTIWDTERNSYCYECKSPYDIQALYNNMIVHSGFMISTAALQEIAFAYQGETWPSFYLNELRTCEDYNLVLRVSKKKMIIHIPRDLCIVRNQPNNSTLTVDKNRWEQDYRLCKQHALGV